MVALGLFFASLIALASASPLFSQLTLHESRDGVPEGFVASGKPDPSTQLNLRIALVQNDPAGLEKALMDVSTPSSALYGQHLSKVSSSHACPDSH